MKSFSISKCVALALLVLNFGLSAQGAETYQAFARRMNASETGEIRFRPDLEAALLVLANKYRASQGVHTLSAAPANLSAARAHAMDMALNDFVGHRSSNGRDFESRMQAFHEGEMFLPSMAENAARASNRSPPDKTKAASLMTQWIKSFPHRRALVSRSYASVATAVVQKGNKLYAVEIFSGPAVKSNIGKATTDTDLY
jgi:uncharacterized protein YkwD